MKVRAVVVTEPRNLEVRELELPAEPPRGGAIMRVVANGLCGSDYNLFNGKVAPMSEGLPVVPGHEMVGRITMIDDDAAARWRVKEGDRVAVKPLAPCGGCPDCRAGRDRWCPNSFLYSGTRVDNGCGLWGGMAEYMVLRPGSAVYRIPDEVSDLDSGLYNALSNGLEWTGKVGEAAIGERVLVLGAGQRGLTSAVVAKEAGAAQVIVTGLNRDRHKLALACEFGATDVLNVEEHDTVAAVRDLTDGEGVDLVVDTTPGATDPILHAIELLRPEGRLVLCGLKGREIAGLFTDKLIVKALQVRGAMTTTDWADVQTGRLLASGRYDWHKLHSHTFGLDEVEHAVRLLGGEFPGEEAIHITIQP
jgi:2-desacetyl-2-hydroxyethyl bacteriochlorophyllide A dehydrogenase